MTKGFSCEKVSHTFFGYPEWCYQNQTELIFIFFFSFNVTNPQDPRFKLISWLLPRKTVISFQEEYLQPTVV